LLELMLLRRLMIFSALFLLARAMPWLMAVFVRMAITLSAVVADVVVVYWPLELVTSECTL
jgi:hypothetical protein